MSTPGPPVRVYVTIINDDDRLTQLRWAHYHSQIAEMMERAGATFRGEWHSSPVALWQNACWCIEIQPGIADQLRMKLATLARDFEQDALLWAETPKVIILS